MLKFFQKILPWLYGAAIVAAIYVVFFMPVGTGQAPVDSNGQSTTQQGGSQEFNLYNYLNSVKSARGKMTFECDFKLENGDDLVVKSTQQFETRGSDSSIIGSTSYALNDDAAVFDDKTYIREGIRYAKTASEYVQSENILLDAGNLNLGKIEECLDRTDDLVSEDGVSCYKYEGSIAYGDMSNNLRVFIRNQNVNIADIQNVILDFTLFVTENNVPYKIVVKFSDAKCMIKSNELDAKNGTATGTLTIAFSGFNGVESINYPAEIDGASEGSYVFTDKLNRYLTATGN